MYVVLDEFWAAWEAANFDDGMAFYSDSPDMGFITDGTVWESKAAAEAAFRPFYDSLESQDIDITQTQMKALTPDIVLVTQTGRYVEHSRAGVVSPEMDFVGSFVWVKEDGTWKALAFHNSMASPPPASLLSLHLLESPSAADEAAYIQALATTNDAILSAGYAGNGYSLWKIDEAQNPEYTPVGSGYVLEGFWTDEETYDLVHGLDVYQTIDQATTELFDRVSTGQRYTRYVRVPTRGPGEG